MEQPVEPSAPILGTGDVQVTLRWSNTADLDLFVTGPDGDQVYYGSRQSSSGGQLDHDANYPCADATNSPVENVFWPVGGAPTGEYVVEVRYYSECYGEGWTRFTVDVLVDGAREIFEGDLAPGEAVTIARFSR